MAGDALLPLMNPIAVFYHCKLSGINPDYNTPIDTNHAQWVVQSQMQALRDSGLSDAAKELHLGINGSAEEAQVLLIMAPGHPHLSIHGSYGASEIPTLNLLRDWVIGHEDWYVLYHHSKGITQPHRPNYDAWRKRMEDAVVWNWRECVAELDRGTDACGCHWLTPETHPQHGGIPFFAGTFWWAKASFLITLPPLPEDSWRNRYAAERWIGMGPRRPVVKDYFPGDPPI